MNKTLLDEFAMAALNGWVSTLKPDATVNCVAVAASLYALAEAMMAEREKRTPQPLMHAVPEDPRFPDGSSVAAPVEPEKVCDAADFKMQILAFANAKSGSRATCSEVFRQLVSADISPTQRQLNYIGMTLSKHGCKRVRSGGKDYYKL